MSRSVTGVLRGARKLLTTAGWVKGDDHRVVDGESKFCARGAVQIAAGGRIVSNLSISLPYYDDQEPHVSQWADVNLDELDYTAYNEAMDVLNRVAGKKFQAMGAPRRCDIVGYNDIDATSYEDVLDTFDQAIALAEAEQVVRQFETPAPVSYEDDAVVF